MKLPTLLNMGRKSEQAKAAPTPADNFTALGRPDSAEERVHGELSTSERSEELKTTVAPPRGHRLYERFGHPELSPQLIGAISRRAGVQLATDKLIDEICKLIPQSRNLRAFILAHTVDAARAAYAAQQRSLLDGVKEGNARAATACDAWTVADWVEDFNNKRRAAKMEIRALQESMEPIVKAVAENAGKAAALVLPQVELEEREKALEFGVEFQPSPALIAVGQLTWRWRELALIPASPETALERFGITIKLP